MNGDLSSIVSNSLYTVSAALLLPTLLALCGLLAVTLLHCGGFVRECLDRSRVRAALRRSVNLLTNTEPNAAAARAELAKIPSGPGRGFVDALSDLSNAEFLRKALDDVDVDVAARLGRLGFVSRVGPMLGLMGTLIPFGPALNGLSAGDVQVLSSNLVTAFASTVAGLFCGCVAYAIAVVRRGWYAKDFNDLDFIVGRLTALEGNGGDAQAKELGNERGRSDRRVGQPV